MTPSLLVVAGEANHPWWLASCSAIRDPAAAGGSPTRTATGPVQARPGWSRKTVPSNGTAVLRARDEVKRQASVAQSVRDVLTHESLLVEPEDRS